MNKDMICSFSLRVLSEGNDPLGSGFLYLPPGDRAYIFTAAHVIFNSQHDKFRVEFFHREEQGEGEGEEQNYHILLHRQDFVHDMLYRKNGDNPFDPHDIAGAAIDKADWMKDSDCFYIAEPIRELPLYCVGFPGYTYDADIAFAKYELEAAVKETSHNRIQFSINDPVDLTDVVRQLKGMSGAMLAVNAGGDDACITGLWTMSHRSTAVGGTFNGLTSSQIILLCRQNNWPVPISRIIEFRTIDGNRVPFIDDSGEKYGEVEYRREEYELADAHADIKPKLEEIHEDLFNLQVASALEKSDALLSDISSSESYREEVGILNNYQAYAYMLLGDNDRFLKILSETETFPAESKGLSNIMLANLSMGAGNTAEAKRYIEKAKQSGGETIHAMLFEKYISLLENSNQDLDQDIQELSASTQGQQMTSKEWTQYYNLCANICVLKYNQREKAIKYAQRAFALSTDKHLYLTIAQNYCALAFSDRSAPNIVFADSAVQFFNLYLSYADELLRERFFQTDGCAYIDVLSVIGDNLTLCACIDQVISCVDEEAKKHLRFMKAHALLSMGKYDNSMMEYLSKAEWTALMLHHEFMLVSKDYAAFLDWKCGYAYEKSVSGAEDAEKEWFQIESTRYFIAGFEMLASRITAFLSENIDSSIDTSFQMKQDLLNLYLYMKKGESFCALLDDCIGQYPEMVPFQQLEKYRGEANHEVNASDDAVTRMLDDQMSYDTVKEAISFYLRNGMCKKIRSLYKRALEDARINNFHKDFLIMAYLDYLMLPTTSNAELLSEYLLYRDQMQDDSLKDSITQRIQKRTGIGA